MSRTIALHRGLDYAGRMGDVLLIEGHRLMRRALHELLAQSGFHLVREAADPIEAVQKIVQLAPQVIVLDTTWLEIKGVYLSRMLREVAPLSKIVLLVDESWQHDADAARESGSDAFVAKNAIGEELPPILAQWQLRAAPPSPD